MWKRKQQPSKSNANCNSSRSSGFQVHPDNHLESHGDPPPQWGGTTTRVIIIIIIVWSHLHLLRVMNENSLDLQSSDGSINIDYYHQQERRPVSHPSLSCRPC